jgi:hypothetical protein
MALMATNMTLIFIKVLKINLLIILAKFSKLQKFITYIQ